MDVPQVTLKPKDRRCFHLLWQMVGSTIQYRHRFSFEEIEECLEAMRTVFRKGHRCSEFTEIDFDYLPNCAAYVIRFASCHSYLTKFAADEFFDHAPQGLVGSLLRRHEIKVVSIGGGPGNDLIGFCTSLQEKRPEYTDTTLPLRLDAVVMDCFAGWKEVQEELKNVICRGEFGSVSDFFKSVPNRFEFQQVDLRKKLEDIYEKLQIIEHADVILMVKVLSILHEEDKIPILQTILNLMKPGAIFLFVDTGGYIFQSEEMRNPNVRILMGPSARRQLVIPGISSNGMSESSFQVCVVQRRRRENESSFPRCTNGANVMFTNRRSQNGHS